MEGVVTWILCRMPMGLSVGVFRCAVTLIMTLQTVMKSLSEKLPVIYQVYVLDANHKLHDLTLKYYLYRGRMPKKACFMIKRHHLDHTAYYCVSDISKIATDLETTTVEIGIDRCQFIVKNQDHLVKFDPEYLDKYFAISRILAGGQTRDIPCQNMENILKFMNYTATNLELFQITMLQFCSEPVNKVLIQDLYQENN